MVELISTLQAIKDAMPEQVDGPKGDCNPVGSLCWSRFLTGHLTLQGTHSGTIFS